MRAIDTYKGSIVVRHALLFSALTFCRPGEIRQAEWQEIDFKEKVWIIPESKMKMRKAHIVPLSKQAIAVLKSIKMFTGNGKFVFPSPRMNCGRYLMLGCRLRLPVWAIKQ
jgi:Integrase